MEELDKLWREISEKTKQVESEGRPLPTNDFLPTARNMFAEMLRKVKYKLWFIYGFVGLYGVWAFLAVDSNREIALIVAAMFLFGLLNLWLVLPGYLRMKKHAGLMSSTSRDVLTFYYRELRAIIRQENLMAAIFTPIAAMLGFSFAIIEEKGSFMFIWERTWLLVAMLVTGLLVGALGACAAVWLNRVAFGKYLAYLKENLEQLKEEAE